MNATEKILSVYDKEQLKEIADHGCQSGVCTQHIYYGDTIQFYETFETNILDELTLNYGTEFLIGLFKDADADLTYYKNAVCWAFIEMVAVEAVAELSVTMEALPSDDLAPARLLDEWNNSFEVIPSGSTVMEALPF